jgi:ligand-binding SRPBCC domain-containing protein
MPYRLETRVVLPAPLDTVFAFFADARNLQQITPSFLNFRLLTPAADLRKGTRIDYRLRLRGVPFTWQSEITAWEPGVRFRDEQRRGPYKYWKHVHLFTAAAEGTVVEDGVDYDVPGGRYVHDWFVAPELMRIFTFRQHKLQEIFGVGHADAVKVAIQIKL